MKHHQVTVKRFANNPIIHPGLDDSIGANINGPSLIGVPDWVENPLGRYYLYFAHHQGTFIRMAFSDHLSGPWTVYPPGVLSVDSSFYQHHIASPDVHVDHQNQQIRMYFHGCDRDWNQSTRVALSNDALNFQARPEILGNPYFRVWQWRGYHYAIAMPGILYRSKDGLTGFEEGPRVFTHHLMRHCAVRVEGNTLQVFFSNISDCPERIILSQIEMTPDWHEWKPSDFIEVMKPEHDYEGANLPLEPSIMGWVENPANQLRDPCVFQEEGRLYLLYSVAGESGIAIAEIFLGTP